MTDSNSMTTEEIEQMMKKPGGVRVVYEQLAGKIKTDVPWQYPLPPDGSTPSEQAKWWSQHPELIQIGLGRGEITPDVWEELINRAKNIDEAMRIIDKKKTKGLTNLRRKELFSDLTDGGVWEGLPQNNKSETVRDLLLALEIQQTSDTRQKNRIIRERTDKYPIYGKGNNFGNNISNYRKRIEGLLASFSDVNQDNLVSILKSAEADGVKLTPAQMRNLLGILQYTQEKIESSNLDTPQP